MDAKAALWTFVGIFIVFKVATTAMIVLADPNGAQLVLGLFLALHWPFIVAPVLAGLTFATMGLVFRARLFRMRARRRQLQAAEWRID